MTLMTRGNRKRHQLPADRPRRTCHKHPHHWPLDRGIIYTLYDKTAAPEVTPASTQHCKRLAFPRCRSPAKPRASPQRRISYLDRCRLGGVQLAAEKQDGHGLPAELASQRDMILNALPRSPPPQVPP